MLAKAATGVYTTDGLAQRLDWRLAKSGSIEAEHYKASLIKEKELVLIGATICKQELAVMRSQAFVQEWGGSLRVHLLLEPLHQQETTKIARLNENVANPNSINPIVNGNSKQHNYERGKVIFLMTTIPKERST